MCKVLHVSRFHENVLLDCSEYEGDFRGAKLLKIMDGAKLVLETDQFILEKSKSCFSSHNAPWIMLTEGAGSAAIKKGNEILLQ